MRRRPVLPLSFLLLLVAGAAFFLHHHGREPEYNGLKLSEWLKACAGISTLPDVPGYSKAADAVQHLGTNALPWLIKWTLYDESGGDAKLRALASRLPRRLSGLFRFADPYECRKMGTTGFAILGDAASPAVPDL